MASPFSQSIAVPERIFNSYEESYEESVLSSARKTMLFELNGLLLLGDDLFFDTER